MVLHLLCFAFFGIREAFRWVISVFSFFRHSSDEEPQKLIAPNLALRLPSERLFMSHDILDTASGVRKF